MPLPGPSISPQHCWMCRPSRERMEWPFSVERMWLYGVYCKWPHRFEVSRVTGPCTHTHTPHLSVTGGSDCSVLLFSVQRCSAGRSSQNKQQEESGPLAHSCDLFHLSLSFTLIQKVCQAESWLPFIEQPPHSTAVQTSCVGERSAS